MSDAIELTAELREDVGKGASRRLRRLHDLVPGILYGGRRDPIPLTLKSNELAKAMQNEAFFSQVLTLKWADEEQQAVVRDVQRHPASEKVLHIDFLRVRADRVLTVSVPVHLVGEEVCAGVKAGGSLSFNLNEVEISCLPAAIPEYLELDVSALEEGQSLHLSDIPVPDGVTIVALTYGEDHDMPVVSLVAKRGGASAEEDEDSDAGDADAAEEGGESSDD